MEEAVKSWKFQARTVNDKAAGYGCADCLKTAGMPALTEKLAMIAFCNPDEKLPRASLRFRPCFSLWICSRNLGKSFKSEILNDEKL